MSSTCDVQLDERPLASSSAPTVPQRARRAHDLKRNLHASCGDAGFFGVMVGLGETYLPAFALVIGLGEVIAGLVASVPLIAGGIVQLASPRAVRLLGSHKRWVVLCAALQALTFVPLAIAAIQGQISGWALLAISGIYWGAGMSTGPAWNTWMATLVPSKIRAGFFAGRTRLNQATVLGGFLIGGLLLQLATSTGHVLLAFSALFVIAGLCRAVSSWFLLRHTEPIPIPPNMRTFPLAALFGKVFRGSEGSLLIYLILVQAAAYVAGPYFAPYMITNLEMSYLEYVLLIATAFAGKVIALPLWGRFAVRYGVHRLLWVGGIGIVPIAALWVVSTNSYYLAVIQVFSGIVWAAYELAVMLVYFESIRDDERTSVLTMFNLATAAAMVVGSLLGGAFLKWFGTSREAYYILFALSSAARLATVPLLNRLPAFKGGPPPVSVRTLSLRPNEGSIDRPILPGLPEVVERPEPQQSPSLTAS